MGTLLSRLLDRAIDNLVYLISEDTCHQKDEYTRWPEDFNTAGSLVMDPNPKDGRQELR